MKYVICELLFQKRYVKKNIYAQKAKYEDMNVDTSDEKKLFDFELVKSSQDKKLV